MELSVNPEVLNRCQHFRFEVKAMNHLIVLQQLQARLDRIAPGVVPPTMRCFTINEGEDDQLPDDLCRWDLVVRIEAPLPYHNPAPIQEH